MRLINADVLMEEVNTEVREYMLTEKGICSLIRNAPTIDAVEVVRCGECRHKYMKDFDMFCPHMVGMIKPNMHCSYGEREGE